MTSFYKSYFRHSGHQKVQGPEIQGIMERGVPYDFSSAKIHHHENFRIFIFFLSQKFFSSFFRAPWTMNHGLSVRVKFIIIKTLELGTISKAASKQLLNLRIKNSLNSYDYIFKRWIINYFFFSNSLKIITSTFQTFLILTDWWNSNLKIKIKFIWISWIWLVEFKIF